ncbi:MAG: carbohydrate binding family 9 domain-containing protein, partial [Candidatus Aminicenantes bacterium]|nr:carbohydrate binding family 9 domain-containing protein [Candidatus Aminicenantes bacterium]
MRIFLFLFLGLTLFSPWQAFSGSFHDVLPGQTWNEIPSVPRTMDSLRLDAVLDESFWERALVLDLSYEIDPGENIPARVRTECLVITGPRHLYVGFRAYDPDPSAIRAHYMDRDAAWDDDWVLVTLDPFHDQRRGFEFIANPLGVQMDILVNEVGGSEALFDITWDAIWTAAGKITPEGYVVEMAIPFTTLRFPKEAGEQRWGFQAFRHYPRDYSYHFRTTPWDRNRNCILCENMTVIGFEGVSPGKNVELNPAVVLNRTDRREPFLQGRLDRGPTRSDLGLSGRWGVTPNVMANATVNPDFSQVEADVAQLEVNRRFTLFYPEKRPFFLEGADLFLTPLAAVYTRTLADPAWGLKLTGKEKRAAFGILVSEDETTNLLLPANQGSQLTSLEQTAASVVLRYRRDVGRQSAVGILVTDRRGKAYANNILGADAHLQLGLVDKLRLQVLYARTSYPEMAVADLDQPQGAFSDRALSFAYLHEARDWNWWAKYEDRGRNFRADVGFIPRVDVVTKEAGGRRIVWGESSQWFRKWVFALKGSLSHDQKGALTDRTLEASCEYNGPLQSTFNLGLVAGREVWTGTPFNQEYLRIESTI